uniref:Uncharacterized protein n=1 Tax=Myotis myotis TaxID=51298 RepID=A0A7J7XZR5_MYOMY|nr:hypothetical protein mMyoMyo1_011416 [Myotis myotis]
MSSERPSGMTSGWRTGPASLRCQASHGGPGDPPATEAAAAWERRRSGPVQHQRPFRRGSTREAERQWRGRGRGTGWSSAAAPSAEVVGEGTARSRSQCCPFCRGSHRGSSTGPVPAPHICRGGGTGGGVVLEPMQRLDRVQPVVPQPPTASPPAGLAPD